MEVAEEGKQPKNQSKTSKVSECNKESDMYICMKTVENKIPMTFLLFERL